VTIRQMKPTFCGKAGISKHLKRM